MDITEANRRVEQILDDERTHPTARYSPHVTTPVVVAGPHAFTPEIDALTRVRPRLVYENKLRVRFAGTNYDLLLALMGRVAEEVKQSVFGTIRNRIKNPGAFARAQYPLEYPFWNPFVSELPLVFEMCLRHGDRDLLFQAIAETEASPASLIMLLQLEDTLAFSFTLFSEMELQQLEAALGRFVALSQKHPKRHSSMITNWSNGLAVNCSPFWAEFYRTCQSVIQQCKRAQYLYLKGELLQQANFEVNQDKNAVVSFLQSLGFNPTLLASLEKAEELYRTAGSGFDFKSSMGHLRSFVENLHLEAAQRVHSKSGGSASAPAKWGDAILLLRQQNIFTQKEESLVATFYTVVSDNAVHPLMAEREYARLMRNVAIEYGLLLLSKLQKAGV